MDLVASHFLPGLDWLVKLGIGVIVATAGVLLFRQPRRGGLGFALGLFIAETGTLVAIRALVAAGTSSRWQYIMPFGLVLVPALFVASSLRGYAGGSEPASPGRANGAPRTWLFRSSLPLPCRLSACRVAGSCR